MEGVAGRQKEDTFQGNKLLKILLYSTVNYRKSKPDFSAKAVQLIFSAPNWDLKVNG